MKRSIGIDAKPPEKKCEDENCPWHGRLSLRGKVFTGTVRSAKSHNTAIVEWGFNKFIKKYERYERRKSRVTAHNPPCIHARENELVMIAECRPLTATKRFVVVARLGKGEIEIRGEDKKLIADARKAAAEKEKEEAK
ncbi:MAG: 30S ribosomal protein S17 [Candidatus Aenigmarchaeota archaeon]|nr:30S ribosomal protein S17 [Candidatus Aenigmarchaeota archaeon]